jgi:hypothetical protein
MLYAACRAFCGFFLALWRKVKRARAGHHRRGLLRAFALAPAKYFFYQDKKTRLIHSATGKQKTRLPCYQTWQAGKVITRAKIYGTGFAARVTLKK